MAERAFRIGDRVRLRGSTQLGTVFAVPYVVKGERRCGVVWDLRPNGPAIVAVSSLVKAKGYQHGTVPPEARPLSVGALQHPARPPAPRLPHARITHVLIDGCRFEVASAKMAVRGGKS